jgi:hypothetical protein
MDDPKKSGGAGLAIFVVLAFLVTIPVLYVLSAGPSHWLWTRGYISGDEGSLQWAFYAPMRWACQWEPFCQFIEWYSSFWEAEDPTFN